MRKHIYPLLFVPLLAAGCAHNQPAHSPERASASLERSAAREELLREAGKKAEAGEEKEDDFIDVDDKRGLLKTWPMVLFVALVAAACGVF